MLDSSGSASLILPPVTALGRQTVSGKIETPDPFPRSAPLCSFAGDSRRCREAQSGQHGANRGCARTGSGRCFRPARVRVVSTRTEKPSPTPVLLREYRSPPNHGPQHGNVFDLFRLGLVRIGSEQHEVGELAGRDRAFLALLERGEGSVDGA